MATTLDNHFSYGYGSGTFNPQDKEGDNFWCSYSRCDTEPGTFRDECKNVATRLDAEAKRLNRPIYILLSGGLDSEVVVEAFLDAGVDFRTITYRFMNGLNRHEMAYVDSLVRRHGLDHRFYDIDAIKWIQSAEAAKLYAESDACSASLLPHMRLMNHIWFELGGLPVLGNGDVYLEKINQTWKYVELEYMLSWYRHAVKNNITGGIGFFQFTPQVTLAMLREEKIERLGMNTNPMDARFYDTSRFVKYLIYKKHWPDMSIRRKFYGNELVAKEFTSATRRHHSGRTKHFCDKFVVSYSELRDSLEPAGTSEKVGTFLHVPYQPL